MTELGEDEIQEQSFENYDGKFSLDIEKENRKKVIKYLLAFVFAAVIIIILSNHFFFANGTKEKDNSEFQGETKVNQDQFQIYQQEIQPKYHQGCIQQQTQEINCLKWKKILILIA
ncbi:transmembrane protein, putative (macronuclear) [Tetrahymena thermophila SB210]|uniref:Transmembrane protein, putative n=1 Tax=Tetrahymena thermophila (strain SB210) TaxID=312017 RepID=I7MJJ6_TETTS|nr:transmembrane protein, putative [Tetrahymena thermophila SB210]EAR96417.2 transmembrane protein, putative [Tetrahymena thermophila SB210]|eukprot:XP_001016662.2 transmembrane protein, putative [Tetrahymena thermophila SB210]